MDLSFETMKVAVVISICMGPPLAKCLDVILMTETIRVSKSLLNVVSYGSFYINSYAQLTRSNAKCRKVLQTRKMRDGFPMRAMAVESFLLLPPE